MANIARQQARDARVLLREDRGPVALLTLNRPEARNALSEELIGALTSAIRRSTDRMLCAHRHHRLRHSVLIRPRSQGTDRASQRHRPRLRLLRQNHCVVLEHDVDHRAIAETGDRRGQRHCHGCGLSTGRELRSGGGEPRCALCHARRQYRPVLLYAHGGALPQCLAQNGHGNAAARRDDRRRECDGARSRQSRGAA